jgi:preprotein translocase subunit SecD
MGVRPLAAVFVLLTAPAASETLLTLSTGSKTLEIARSGVADIESSESGGITDVFLRLMPGAAEALGDLTGRSTGGRMELAVCGTVVMAPVIRTRIDSGTIYLAGTTAVRAEAFRALWHGRATCDTLNPEVFGYGN